jgi:hypothetical protein
MTDHQHSWQLVQKYFGDIATDQECLELQQTVQADPSVADAFARAARIDARLDEFFTDSWQSQRVARLLVESAKPTRFRLPGGPSRWVAAAVLVAALGFGVYLLRPTAEVVPCTVVSGRVLVDGVETLHIRDGALVEVVGDEVAVIRLAADGSLAELSPSTKGVLRSRMGMRGQVIELTQGSCEFHPETDQGRLRVETPVGRVFGQGAEFAVALRPPDDEATVQAQLALTLVVAVMSGTVDVRYDENSYTLGLGDNRVYGGGKPAATRQPDLTGIVVAVAEDGSSFTLETPPLAKKEPPGKRTVRLAESTQLSYVNVPVHGEKPTVGYLARVWLAEAAGGLAVAVTFSGPKPSASKPAFTGRVIAVSGDGREITLQLPAKKKGEPAPTVTVHIGDHTKLSYALVPLGGEKPTVGYNASVWLAEGAKDMASAVTFSGKKASAVNPDWTGRVTGVSTDGKELTLQLPSKKKGEAGPTVTVRIHDKTKLVFAGIDKDQQKPTVGFEAAVWLDKGSRDTAAGIRFSANAGKKGNPDKTSAPKAAEKTPGTFLLPKGIELTAEQQAQVAALRKELQPRFQKWLDAKDAVLNTEQKRALKIASQAVKEAGLSDRRQIQQALDAAVNLSPEQKTRMDALAREESELRQTFLDRLQPLLTPEQKAKLTKPAPDGKTVPKTKP